MPGFNYFRKSLGFARYLYSHVFFDRRTGMGGAGAGSAGKAREGGGPFHATHPPTIGREGGRKEV